MPLRRWPYRREPAAFRAISTGAGGLATANLLRSAPSPPRPSLIPPISRPQIFLADLDRRFPNDGGPKVLWRSNYKGWSSHDRDYYVPAVGDAQEDVYDGIARELVTARGGAFVNATEAVDGVKALFGACAAGPDSLHKGIIMARGRPTDVSMIAESLVLQAILAGVESLGVCEDAGVVSEREM